ncbi:hypothetical protein niasHS_013098 [Heterodera schachtii]|uniref:Uncharacterized protein n=1 Tax=Heterodera schachtii TaxID=97005 RepID=A0ABD2IAG2_HETSC
MSIPRRRPPPIVAAFAIVPMALFGSASSATQQNHLSDSLPPGDSSASSPCPSHPFAFECRHSACCASYHQRFLMLLFSLAIFAFALLVLIIWLAIEWRPRRWRRSHRNGKRMSEVEIRSSEETRYLRRMSELNPNARREIVDG